MIATARGPSTCRPEVLAHLLRDYEVIVASSATGTGLVNTAFEDRLRPSVLTVQQTGVPVPSM